MAPRFITALQMIAIIAKVGKSRHLDGWTMQRGTFLKFTTAGLQNLSWERITNNRHTWDNSQQQHQRQQIKDYDKNSELIIEVDGLAGCEASG